MATYTPPPYFPQGSLAPPDEKRYRKFKTMIVAAVFVLLLILAGAGIGLWYALKWIF